MRHANLESAETSRLRGKAVCLEGRRGSTTRTSCNHETVAENGSVILLLLSGGLLGLAGLIVSLEQSKLLGLLGKHIDHVWHSEVVQTMTPRKLQDDVRADELVASIQHADVALATANVDELRWC